MTDQHKAEPVTSPPQGRALAVVGPRRPNPAAERPEAVFLAQLIACERRLPAYRQARNAEPEAASAAYSRLPGAEPARLDRVI